MGKKVYTVNNRLYIVDDETGKVRTIVIQDDPIPPKDLEDLIKLLAKNQRES